MSEDKPLISVIIPCYNVEQYVDRCMRSLEQQTIGIENLEVILVNDASTDHTLERLQAWEKKYPEQILVVTYGENLRQGGARNIGLQYATADYIGFVDSDDWIEKDMYQCLYEIMQEGTYDVVRGKLVRDRALEDASESKDVSESENISESEDSSKLEPAREDWSYQFEDRKGWYYAMIDQVGNNGVYGSICTSLFRRSLIIDHEIWFPEKIAYEDNYWWGTCSCM